MQYLQHMLDSGPMVWVLVTIAIVLFLCFLFVYCLRGLRLRYQLKQLSGQLKDLLDEPRPSLRVRLNELFASTRCDHAWSEYAETLHDQYDQNAGERRVTDIRATSPAESFLNTEAIVDPRIGSEFFRHLPGIFTGLGIIGTFFGLIRGLMAFDPGVDAEKLKQSLGGLFANVMDAFIFSMTAIALAMLVTLIEKWIYASCTKWMGQVANNVDSLFRSGLGEEYLSSLVRASQDNATQTRQLKESLVEDLKALLVELTERQIAATQALSTNLGKQIENSLTSPLASLADTVRAASTQQATAASNTLEALMRAFIDRMQETFGGQLDGMGEMLRTAGQSMGQVEASLRTLVNDLRQAGTESTAGMQQAMQSLLQQVATQQQQQASQSAAGLDNLLTKVQAALAQVVQLQDVAREGSAQAISTLAEAMQSRINELAQSNQQTQADSAALAKTMGEVSTRTITGMESGAKAVNAALQGVAQATTRLEAVAGNMASLQAAASQSARQLAESSTVVGGATQALSTAVGAFSGTAQKFEQLGTVVQTEATARSAMLNDLQTLTRQTQSTGESLNQLTDAVRQKLDESLDRFGGAITRTLEQNLATYNKQLSDAVNTLVEAYNELTELLEPPAGVR